MALFGFGGFSRATACGGVGPAAADKRALRDIRNKASYRAACASRSRNPRSPDRQLAICRSFRRDEGWSPARPWEDRPASVASVQEPEAGAAADQDAAKV